MEPNIPNLRRWRDALRTTKRPQGRGDLKKRPVTEYMSARVMGEYALCCLGIWCDLLVQDGVLISKENKFGSVMFGWPDKDWDGEGAWASEVELPQGIQSLLVPEDCESGDVEILYVPDLFGRDGGPMRISAISANDLLGLTFDQIADCLTWNYRLDG